jgi:hypothetical protein
MKKAKVTKFKGSLKNTILPVKQTQDNGLVGKVLEDLLRSKGLGIDSKTAGPDVAEFDLEVKSRRKGSNAELSVGTISVDQIVKHDFQNSILKDKVKTVLYVVYDENSPFVDPNCSVVDSDAVLDLTHERIQKEIEKHYNISRHEIVTNNDSYKIGSRVGWWEKKKPTMWAFRIPFANWKRYVTYNQTNDSFNQMFSSADTANAN